MKTLLSIGGALILIYGSLFAQGAGGALFFDGVNDYVGSMNNIGISGNSPRTASAWVKSAQLYSTTCCPTPFSWGAPSIGMGFGNFISSGKWWFWGYQNDINTGVDVNLEWNHHCITYDGSQVLYYLNGTLIANQSKSLNTAISPFFVGDGFDHRVDTPFNGAVDEIRVWKRVLTPEEIRVHIFRRLTQQEIADTTLVGYWRFNEGAGSTTTDSSGSSNHGALVNMDTTTAWISSTVPLATAITTLTDIAAVWAGLDSNASSIISAKDDDISGDDAVIFGHDNGGLSLDTMDVPSNLGILQRLNRVWRLEVFGTLAGDFIFDVRNLDITNGNALKLLVDSDGVFSNADTAGGVYSDADSIFVVSELNFQHGSYYTLGTEESPMAIGSIARENFPKTPQLGQNYPNPFNPTTTINYKLAVGGVVKLTIYNLLGEQIRTLLNGYQSAGAHQVQWDGRDNSGEQVTTGIYYYKLKVGMDFAETKKMVLLR